MAGHQHTLMILITGRFEDAWQLTHKSTKALVERWNAAQKNRHQNDNSKHMKVELSVLVSDREAEEISPCSFYSGDHTLVIPAGTLVGAGLLGALQARLTNNNETQSNGEEGVRRIFLHPTFAHGVVLSRSNDARPQDRWASLWSRNCLQPNTELQLPHIDVKDLLGVHVPAFEGCSKSAVSGDTSSLPNGWSIEAHYGVSSDNQTDVTCALVAHFMRGDPAGSILIPSLTNLNNHFGDTAPNSRKRLHIIFQNCYNSFRRVLDLTETSARNDRSYFCTHIGNKLKTGRPIEWDTNLESFMDAHPNSIVPAFWFHSENNFGDMLTPHILTRLSGRQVVYCAAGDPVQKIVATGSILDNPIKNAIVWGAGYARRADKLQCEGKFVAVRGPMTAAALHKQHGTTLVNVQGDPGLLVSHLFPEIVSGIALGSSGKAAVVPHMCDHAYLSIAQNHHPFVLVNLRDSVSLVLSQIRAALRVFSSSLHGLICAHALGVPARWVIFSNRVHGDHTKFLDFYASLGACCGSHIPTTTCECHLCHGDSGACCPLDWRDIDLTRHCPAALQSSSSSCSNSSDCISINVPQGMTSQLLRSCPVPNTIHHKC